MAKRRKKHSVEAAGGFTLQHDGRAKFDIAPFVPLIQLIAEVWYFDDIEEEEEALGELLNPPASKSETAHRATIIGALDEWGFYAESLTLAQETIGALGAAASKKNASLRKAIELAFRRAEKPSPFAAKKSKRKKGSYGMEVAAEQWAKSTAKAIIKGRKELSGPISTIGFFLHQTGTTPWEAYIWTGKSPETLYFGPDGDWELEVDASHKRTKHIPSTVDMADPLLDAFCEATGFDSDETSWGPKGIPGQMWVLELQNAMRLVHELLTDSSVEIRKNAKVAVYDEDGELFARITKKQYESKRKKALAALGDARDAYVALCYSKPPK